jgi:hypothetical protein
MPTSTGFAVVPDARAILPILELSVVVGLRGVVIGEELQGEPVLETARVCRLLPLVVCI